MRDVLKRFRCLGLMDPTDQEVRPQHRLAPWLTAGRGTVGRSLTGQARCVVTLGQALHGSRRHDHVDDARAKASHRVALFIRSTQEYLELLSI